MLEFGYENVSKREVENLFGKEFASALVDVQPKTWHGPLQSGYGVHAVIVDEFQPDERPNLNQVRQAVRRCCHEPPCRW